MKQILKSKFFTFLLGAVIFGSIGVYAGTKISASNVDYKETTVDEALNSLYTTQNTTVSNLQQQLNAYKSNFDNITISITAQSWNNSSNSNAQLVFYPFFHKYKYFKVTSSTKTGNGTCEIKAWNISTSSSIDVSLNTQYLRSTYSTVYSRAKSSSNAECACQISVQFYN